MLILPFHPETASATIEIDGVTYRVPIVDSDGHLQVDVLSAAIPTGAATSAKQDTMITALQLIDDLRNALASVASDELRARIIANVLATDAATATNQATMITALQLIDDLRAALDAVGTDRLRVNVFGDGASEVKSEFHATVSDSSTRATMLTPTSGKKIRIIAAQYTTLETVNHTPEMYFGTGATILTDTTKAVFTYRIIPAQERSYNLVYPDGGGPVGAVDDVLSIRTTLDISGNGWFTVHYREE